MKQFLALCMSFIYLLLGACMLIWVVYNPPVEHQFKVYGMLVFLDAAFLWSSYEYYKLSKS